MEQVQIPDFILKRLGLEVAKNQLLEEQLAEQQKANKALSDALKLKGEGLVVGEEGVDSERLSEALEVVRDAETA